MSGSETLVATRVPVLETEEARDAAGGRQGVRLAVRRRDHAGARRARPRRRPDRRLLPGARRAADRGRLGGRGRGRAGRRGGRGAGGLDRLAPALPQGRRPGRPAHRRAGGRAGEAHRARRPPREAGDGRGQPPPRRLDREALPQPGAAVPRSDPGGDDRARARRGEVRLPQGLQVLDVRDVVDPPGGRACARRQGPDDPDARARRREAEQDRPLRAQAPRRARPRAESPSRSPATST